MFYVYFGVLLVIAVILPLVFYFSLFLQRGVLYFYFGKDTDFIYVFFMSWIVM